MGRFRMALSDAEYSAPETGDSNQKRRVAKKDSDLSLLAVPTDFGVPPLVLKAMETEEPERTEEQQELVTKHFLWSQPDLQESIVRLAKLEAERTLLQAAIPSVITTERTRPRETRILRRGNFLDETGDLVSSGDSCCFRKIGDSRGQSHSARSGELACFEGQSANASSFRQPDLAAVLRDRAIQSAGGPRITGRMAYAS